MENILLIDDNIYFLCTVNIQRECSWLKELLLISFIHLNILNSCFQLLHKILFFILYYRIWLVLLSIIFWTNNDLQSHPIITFEERSRLCRCLNYTKLTFEASKDLAKNPRIPPRVAMQALISQQSKVPTIDYVTESPRVKPSQLVLYNGKTRNSFTKEKKEMELSIDKMQWGVIELAKLHKEMNGHVSKLILLDPPRTSSSPRFCWVSFLHLV